MKLRRIQLVGFKSFKDKVTIEFSDDMNGIVGPNGCGKSNVVDALKWAMGDMSPKSLRGSSLSDVIFAGSENHRQGGMAEVTLTFENEPDDVDGDEEPVWSDAIPREYREMSEISITRRLHRSGDSEYLINKVQCRLMDIRNLLAGTGLGKQGYSIIEQGEIAFVVSAKPSERRLIIEEASGITRYKAQRDRAQRKLDRTDQNLQRLRDVVSEVDKQLRSLERQARRAERYTKLTKELRSLEIAAIVDRRAKLAEKAAKLRKTLESGRTGAEKVREALQKLEAQLSDQKVEAFQAEKKHSELTEHFYKLDTRLNLARSNRKHLDDSAAEAKARHEEARAEHGEQLRRKEELAAELERVRAELAEVDESPQDSRARLQQAEEELSQLKDTLRQAERSREEARSELDRARSKLRRHEDRRAWLASQDKDLEERREHVDAQIEEVAREAEDLRRSLNRFQIDVERAEERLAAARRRKELAESQLSEAKARLSTTRDELESLRSQRIEVAARIESLEQMRRRGEGYAEGVRRVLEWARESERDDVLGPVGDFLEVAAGRESAVAAYLGDRLSDVVVSTRQAALDAVSMLASEEAGRAGFFVLPQPDAAPRAALEQLADGLQLVDSLEDATSFDDHLSARATEAGIIEFADGRIVGGHLGEQAETVLRQGRELKELVEQRDELQEREADAREVFEVAGEDVAAAEDELGEARQAVEKASLAKRRIEQELGSERRELERTDKRLRRVKAEVAPLQERMDKLAKERDELEKTHEAVGQKLPELEQTLQERVEAFEELQERLETRQQAVTERKVALAEQKERRRSLHNSVERLERSLESTTQRIEKLDAEARQQAARLEEFADKTSSTGEEVAELEQKYADAKAAAEAAREHLDQVNDQVRQLEVAIVERRRDVESQLGSVQETEMSLREMGIEIEHVDRNLRERFDLGLEAAKQAAEEVEMAADKRDKRIERLRRKIDKMGAVNPMAVEEYEEARERKEFLEEQQLDLEASIDDLNKAIRRMDRESRKRFQETFDAVNERFQEFFPRLFRGGHAKLTLTDPDDVLDSGVDIEVSPPGKRLQNVSLLSGGEKALTAVSLIFAIFSLKPTPFSVLDEVDAPLDEANVGRFAEMVRELSQKSQMIVITHNRRTMESCDMLYGVTMEEPGVSKIVSVRLHELDDRLAS